MLRLLPLLIFIALMGNSCALLFMPKNQKVAVSASEKTSKIYVDGELQGTKSANFKTAKNGIKQVRIETPGYKDNYYVMVPNRRQAGFWACIVGDAMFTPVFYGIYGLLFDPKIAKSYAYQKSSKYTVAGKYATKSDDEKFVRITNIGLDINLDTSIVFLNAKFPGIGATPKTEDLVKTADSNKQKEEDKAKKKKNKKDLENEENEQKALQYDNTKFAYNIHKTLRNSGYIDTVNKVFQDNNNTLFLEGKITKWKLYRFGQKSTYNSFYKTKLFVTWYVKNQYDEVLDSVNLSEMSGDFLLHSLYKSASTKDDEISPIERMIGDAIDNSYNKLFTTSTFKKYIKTESIPAYTEPMMSLGAGNSFVADKSDAASASVIIKRKDKGHGSGFAVSKDGYILTNYHVVASTNAGKQEEVTVLTTSGDELKATVVRYNKARDLALLKVDKKFDKVFAISNEKKFKPMQDVFTIGAPKSIELGQTVTSGIISNERKSNNNELLQLSMAINFGNSGGPLFDTNGNLHGVIVSKMVGDTEGIGFAIPAYKIGEYLNLKY